MKKSKINPFMNELNSKIKNLENSSNNVEALVEFYKLAEYIENGEHAANAYLLKLKNKNFFGFNNKKIEKLKSFLKNNTRNPYGTNRSQKGKNVDPKDIYLGNTFGLWTFSAHHWLKKKEKLEREKMDSMPKVTVWQVINDQAGIILNLHLSELKKSKKELLYNKPFI